MIGYTPSTAHAPRSTRLGPALGVALALAGLATSCGDDSAAGTSAGGGPATGPSTGTEGGTTSDTTSAGAGGSGADGAGGSGAQAGGGGAGEGGAGGVVDVPVDLPGSIEGVEPEAHSHHPPMIDGNGNLYRVTESEADDGNQARMMRSTDGGATWSEVDAGNRPEAHDLEGCWQLQADGTIHLSVAATSTVWWTTFHTSDAADRPDQWVTDETVEEDLGNDGGVVQFSSMVRTSDGQVWLFYSDTLADDRQQIGYRRRSAAGDWGPKGTIGSSDGSWTGPTAILGAGDVTHVIYKDHEEDQLLWRTLSPAGVLSDATRLDTSGTSSERLPHTNAVRHDQGGDDVVVVAFATGDGELRAVTVTDGEVGPEEPVSMAPVLQNPDIAKNDGVVAHLALDGTTVHALWADLDTGDVEHAVRAADASWSTPETAWDSGDGVAWWVYGNVYQRGAHRRLGFTYDVGEHADDVGAIEYDEITLTP